MADDAGADVDATRLEEQVKNVTQQVENLTLTVEALNRRVNSPPARRVNPRAAANTKPAGEVFWSAVRCSIYLSGAVVFSCRGFHHFSEFFRKDGKKGGS